MRKSIESSKLQKYRLTRWASKELKTWMPTFILCSSVLGFVQFMCMSEINGSSEINEPQFRG